MKVDTMIDQKKQIIFSIIDQILEDKEGTDKKFGKGVGLPEVDKSVFDYVDGLIEDKNSPR